MHIENSSNVFVACVSDGKDDIAGCVKYEYKENCIYWYLDKV
jgi:hypothetical protein